MKPPPPPPAYSDEDLLKHGFERHVSPSEFVTLYRWARFNRVVTYRQACEQVQKSIQGVATERKK